MFRLVWPIHRHAEVIGLLLCELGQLHADAIELQAGDFIELLQRANLPTNVAVSST